MPPLSLFSAYALLAEYCKDAARWKGNMVMRNFQVGVLHELTTVGVCQMARGQ